MGLGGLFGWQAEWRERDGGRSTSRGERKVCVCVLEGEDRFQGFYKEGT